MKQVAYHVGGINFTVVYPSNTNVNLTGGTLHYLLLEGGKEAWIIEEQTNPQELFVHSLTSALYHKCRQVNEGEWVQIFGNAILIISKGDQGFELDIRYPITQEEQFRGAGLGEIRSIRISVPQKALIFATELFGKLGFLQMRSEVDNIRVLFKLGSVPITLEGKSEDEFDRYCEHTESIVIAVGDPFLVAQQIFEFAAKSELPLTRSIQPGKTIVLYSDILSVNIVLVKE